MSWPAATALFFAYIAAAAWGRRGIDAAKRRRVTAFAALAAAGALVSVGLPAGVLRHWIVPPALLLVAYWISGMLFVRPMPRAEEVLLRVDRALRVPAIARRMPAAVAGCLELAYAGVYPLVPVALAVHLACTPSPDADRFWTVILITDFICFGMLPWIQTRPPRSIEPEPPWRSSIRAFNVKMLREASICVNTVPSGHAAEALAAALLVAGASVPVEAAMWLAALGVSAGAVLGRYHFALDAISGWGVALIVWMSFAAR